MKSCTLLSVPPSARTVTASRWRWLLPLMGLLALGQVASAQYSFDNATTTVGIAGNLGSLASGSSRSTPVLVDLNNDGKLDIVTGSSNGTFRYFENNGTAKYRPATPGSMSWNLSSPNPFAAFSTISQGGSSSPSFVDIDGDGDLDMFSGDGWGRIHFYENLGANSFTERFDAENPFYYEDLPSNVGVYVPVTVVGGSSTIGFLDGDGDGDMDAVLGNSQGEFYYAENRGSVYAPLFIPTPVSQPIFGLGEEIDGPRTATPRPAPQVLQNIGTNTNRSATVCVVDMNCDGIYDVLSGTRAGTFQFRQLTQTITNRFASIGGGGFPLESKDVGTSGSTNDYSYPAAGDLDGDGDIDFISGLSAGGFRYFRNTTCNTAPTFTPNVCGNSYTVVLNTNGDTERILSAGDFGGPSAMSGCLNPASMVFTPDIVTCANVGTPVAVTLQARDNVTGVKSSPTGCTVTLTVNDVTLPTAVCVPFYDVEVGTNNVTLGTVPVSAVENGSTDNCTSNTALVKTLSYNYATTIPLDCSNVGTTGYQISLTVRDASNNVSLPCVTTVRVVDTKGPLPTVASLPTLTRELCNYDASLNQFLFGYELPVPTATDRCNPGTLQNAVRVKVNGGALETLTGPPHTWLADFTVGSYTLTWEYEDGQLPANVTTQTQTLVITSAKLQFPNCPISPIVYDPPASPTTCTGFVLSPSTLFPDLSAGTVTLCGGTPTPTVTVTGTHTASSQFPYGTTTVYYSAQDGAGNVGNCSFKVVVNDPIAQLNVTFPTNFVNTTITPIANIPAADFLCNNFTPAIPLLTNCIGIVVPDDGGTNCGRNVFWTGAPTVTNTQHSCAGPYTVRTEIAIGSPSGTPGTVVNSGSFFPVGLTLLNFVAVDSKGNTYILADFYVEVQNQAPVISCPQSTITVNAPTGQCSASVAIPNATVIDNCPGTIISPVLSGTLLFNATYGLGYVNTPTAMQFTATDAHGAQATCTVNVYVKDTQKPTFTSCPTNITVTDPNLVCGEIVSFTGPGLSDNCALQLDSVSAVIKHPDFSDVTFVSKSILADYAPSTLVNTISFNEGVSTILYTAIDLAGNTGTCQFTITLRDNIVPIVYCPLNPVVSSTEALCRDTIARGLYNDGLNAITVSPVAGACGTPTVTYRLPSTTADLPSNTTFAPGLHTLMAVATDRSGNTSTCQFQIDVKDLNPPVSSNCPSDITVDDTDGGCGQAVTWSGPTFTDDCTASNALTIVRTPNMPSGSFFPVGTTSLSIVARDASLNQSAPCLFNVTVLDKTKPVIVCPSNIVRQVVNSDANSCGLSVDFTVTAADDCTDINGGYVDLFGLSFDTEPGNPDADLIATEAVIGYYVTVGAPVTLIYSATDLAGNTNTCSFTITIEDKQGPEIYNCPGDISVSAASCTGTPVVWTAPYIVLDNCYPATSASLSPPNRASGSTFAPGTTVVRYVASDNLNNTRECTFNVIVQEGTAPAFTPLVSNANTPPCAGYVVNIAASDCSNNGTLSSLTQLTIPGATDNCAPTTVVPTLMADVPPYNTALTFPQTITGSLVIVWKATDASGNTATCSQTVIPVDKTAPTLTCPTYTYTLLANQTQFDVCANETLVKTNSTAVDNCSGVMANSSIVPVPTGQQCQFPVGSHPFYWQATDGSTNTGTCIQTIVVVGTTQPCAAAMGTRTITSLGTYNLGDLSQVTYSVAPCCATPVISTITITGPQGNATLNSPNFNYTFATPGSYSLSYSATCSTSRAGQLTEAITPITITVTVTVNNTTCTPSLPAIATSVNQTVNLSSLASISFSTSGCCISPTFIAVQITTGPIAAFTPANPAAHVFTVAGNYTAQYTITCGGVNITFNRSISVSGCTSTQPPSITCGTPTNITVNANAGACFASLANVNLGTVTVGDNCSSSMAVNAGGGTNGTITVSNNAPSQFSVSAPTVVTITASNTIGAAVCTKLVTVTANAEVCGNSIDDDCDGQTDEGCTVQTLTLTCPADINVEADPDGNCQKVLSNIGTAVVGGTCPTPGTPTNDGLGVYNVGITVVTWEVTGCALTATCEQIIEITDAEDLTVDGIDQDCDGVDGNGAPSGCPWDESLKRVASDGALMDNYGMSVAVDGDWAVVGAPWEDDGASNNNRGAVYVYHRLAANNWNFERKITPSDGLLQDLFGESVSIFDNSGDPVIVVGARWHDNSVASSQQGAAYVYRKDRGSVNNWGLVKKLVAGDRASGDEFGASVDIDGDIIVVGAPNEDLAPNSNNGAVYFFRRDEGGTEMWGQVAQQRANDRANSDGFGASVSYTQLAGGDGYAIVGSRLSDPTPAGSESGSAYIFRRNMSGTNAFGQMQKLTALDGATGDQFGTSVSIDGTTAVVGAPMDNVSSNLQQGSAYIYDLVGSVWTQMEKLTASDGVAQDQFGYAVSIDGNNVVVGARYDNVREGSFYLFNRNNGGTDAWGEVVRQDPSDGQSYDQFATSISISGCNTVVGSPKHNIGANNDQGAAYFFDCGCADPQARQAGIQVLDRAQPKSEILDFTGGFAARCFPNPFSELLNIELIVEEETEARISVSDATGRVVSQVYNGLATPGQRFQWDAADFPTGLYFVRIEAGANRKVVPVSMVK